MFRKLMGRTLLILSLVPFSLPVYADSGSYNLSINSGGHLWLDGNSTLHTWESVTSTFTLKTNTFAADSPTISGYRYVDCSDLREFSSSMFRFNHSKILEKVRALTTISGPT